MGPAAGALVKSAEKKVSLCAGEASWARAQDTLSLVTMKTTSPCRRRNTSIRAVNEMSRFFYNIWERPYAN